MRYIKHIKWIIPALFLSYISWQTFLAKDSLAAVTNFQERTPWFDVLLPAGRVERMGEVIVLKQEPVYIDVRLPVRAKSIALELKVTANSAPIKLGWQTDDNFSIIFSESEPVKIGSYMLYHYDLASINYVRPGNKTRFVISSPGLVPGSVAIEGASLSIKRQLGSFTWWRQYFSEIIWTN